MPNFNVDGYLPAGIHTMTEAEIESDFVTAFPTSNTRPQILSGYKRHRSELEALGIKMDQFIDGSFTTNKTDPGDVDMVCFAMADEIDNLSAADQQKLRALVSGKTTRHTHMCDAYFCPVVPENDPLYDKTRPQRKYWMGEFGFDRQDKPKGIVHTNINGGLKP